MNRRRAVVLVLLLTALAAYAQADRAMATLENMQNAFRYVAKKVLPSVVEIDVVDVVKQPAQRVNPFFFFFGPRGQGDNPGEAQPQDQEFRREGLGSGVIVRKDGIKVYVLTNDHVVGDAEQIRINLNDGRKFDAKLVGRDPRRDMALVSFESRDPVPVADLGDSNRIEVGDWAVAVGNPLGFESTVTVGIISAIGRQAAPGMQGGFNEYIQTDAAINQGNSGGALANIRGEVIGINSWIASPSGGNVGLGFAIPINSAKKVVDDFINKGRVEYGWLGINVGDIPDEMADDLKVKGREGGFVYSVFQDSPADKAGILPGDFVTSIDGEQIRNTNHLLRVVGGLPPGRRVRFDLIRYSRPMTITVTIAAREDDQKIEARQRAVWPGLSVMRITDRIRDQLRLSRGVGDLVVSNVSDGSPAGIAGFRPGDIVRAVNNQDVRNVMDFYRALNETRGREVNFQIYREGTRITLGLVR
jgi:Do/DeqQ family serine protease